MVFQKVRMSLLYELWCIDIPFSHEELEKHASFINCRPTVMAYGKDLLEVKDKDGKSVLEKLEKKVKIDEKGYPYWDCEKGMGKRHYVMYV